MLLAATVAFIGVAFVVAGDRIGWGLMSVGLLVIAADGFRDRWLAGRSRSKR